MQMTRITRASFVVVLFLAAWTPAWAASGSLKVTSFPSGAQVWIDGVDTGKVTPMSVSLAEGDHLVTVQLPNSGWNPDTRR
jgi:PEGA domain